MDSSLDDSACSESGEVKGLGSGFQVSSVWVAPSSCLTPAYPVGVVRSVAEFPDAFTVSGVKLSVGESCFGEVPVWIESEFSCGPVVGCKRFSNPSSAE